MRRRGSVLYGSEKEIEHWAWVWKVTLRHGLVIHQFDPSNHTRQHQWPKASCWEVASLAWVPRVKGYVPYSINVPEGHRAIQCSRVFNLQSVGALRIYLLGYEAPNDQNRTVFSSAPSLRSEAGEQNILYVQPPVRLVRGDHELVFPGMVEGSKDPHHKTIFELWLDHPRPVEQIVQEVKLRERLRV